jgi:hypothetical protein
MSGEVNLILPLRRRNKTRPLSLTWTRWVNSGIANQLSIARELPLSLIRVFAIAIEHARRL